MILMLWFREENLEELYSDVAYKSTHHSWYTHGTKRYGVFTEWVVPRILSFVRR